MGNAGGRWRRIAVAAVVVLGLGLLATVVAGRLWRFGPTEITAEFSTAPSWTHPMGTDTVGHDLLARVLRGVETSARIAIVVGVLSTAIGVGVGVAAGYAGGVVDAALMRITDAFLIVPGIAILAVLASSVRDRAGDPVGGDWVFLGLVLSGLLWAHKARLVRSRVLTLREAGYVEAARAAGATAGRVVGRHLLPHVAGLAVVAATLSVSAAILAEATLSYLGLGLAPPDTSLGTLVAEGQGAFSTRPWLFLFPGLTLVGLVLSVALLGEAVRRAVDEPGPTTAPAASAPAISP